MHEAYGKDYDKGDAYAKEIDWAIEDKQPKAKLTAPGRNKN